MSISIDILIFTISIEASLAIAWLYEQAIARGSDNG